MLLRTLAVKRNAGEGTPAGSSLQLQKYVSRPSGRLWHVTHYGNALWTSGLFGSGRNAIMKKKRAAAIVAVVLLIALAGAAAEISRAGVVERSYFASAMPSQEPGDATTEEPQDPALPDGTTPAEAAEEAAAESTGESAAVDARQDAVTSGVLPVIAVQTKSTDENVMDFVTRPVAKHVAESLAARTEGYEAPEPYYERCAITVTDADGAVLLYEVNAEVKVRGNWTTSYNKKPLRIKFAEKQSLLGMNGGNKYKSWVLLAEYKDISMLRNKVALQMAREILGADGYYASDARLVEVTINGKYYGVYLLVEQQQVKRGRIEITSPEEGYSAADIGYFLEYDGYYKNEDALQQFRVSYCDDAALIPYDGSGGGGRTATPLCGGSNDVGFAIKSDINSQTQHDFIASYIENVYRIMYEAAYNDKAFVFNRDYSELSEDETLTSRQAVEAVIDVQSLVDSYIICEITCDADIYWSSFFMDVDFGLGGSRKLTFEAPWDFDSALANKDRCASGEGFYAANIVVDVNGWYESINPWLAVLANEDWYQQMVRERWTKAFDDGVFDRAIQMIKDDSTAYEAAFVKNYNKWRNNIRNDAASKNRRNAAVNRTEKKNAEYLAEWLGKRVDFLNGEWHL